MGIYHFAGLGRSPGAVTTGLSYIRKKYDSVHAQHGNMVEGLVLFTSPEVASGDLKPYPGTVHNVYEKRVVKKKWTFQHEDHTVGLVQEFMEREFPDTAIYLVEVDINNHDNCLEQVARTLLKFHPPADVGKHTWINITGGSNLLNAGLFQAAYLSGIVSRLYYTFVANVAQDGKYLQPFSTNPNEFRYGEIVPIKMGFGPRHLKILEILQEQTANDPDLYLSSGELLNRLKRKDPAFDKMGEKNFLRNFLNVMSGIEQKGDRQQGQKDAVRLSEEGREILHLTQKRPLFRALVLREQPDEITVERLLDELDIKQLR